MRMMFWCPQERVVKLDFEVAAGEKVTRALVAERKGDMAAKLFGLRDNAPITCPSCGVNLYVGSGDATVEDIVSDAASPLLGTFAAAQ